MGEAAQCPRSVSTDALHADLSAACLGDGYNAVIVSRNRESIPYPGHGPRSAANGPTVHRADVVSELGGGRNPGSPVVRAGLCRSPGQGGPAGGIRVTAVASCVHPNPANAIESIQAERERDARVGESIAATSFTAVPTLALANEALLRPTRATERRTRTRTSLLGRRDTEGPFISKAVGGIGIRRHDQRGATVWHGDHRQRREFAATPCAQRVDACGRRADRARRLSASIHLAG